MTKKPKKAAAKPEDEKKPEPKPEAKPETKPETSVPPRRPLPEHKSAIPGMSWTLLALAVILGGGYATLPLWSPLVVDYLPALQRADGNAPVDDGLNARLAELEQELSKVRASGGSIQDLESERGRINEQMTTLMARLNVIEGQVVDVRKMITAAEKTADMVRSNDSLERLSNRLSQLEESGETFDAIINRLAELETTVTESASPQLVKAQSRVLAVGYLRETLSTSAPFTRALEAVRVLGGDDADFMRMVGGLEPHAGSGIPTVKMLFLEFDQAARAIAAAAPAPALVEEPAADAEPADDDLSDGLLGGAMKRLKGLVKVRRIGGGPSPFAEKLAQASDSIGRGDLKAAIDLVGSIDNPAAAAAAAPWLNRARARRMADTAVASLHVQAISLLAPETE